MQQTNLKEISSTSPDCDSRHFSYAVPKDLDVAVDNLRVRIDFYNQSTTITVFEGDKAETRLVDAMDIAHALSTELNFSTGMLPEGCLWWSNSREGPLYAIYSEPQVRKLALQTDIEKPPKRYNVPMPGLIFLCRPAAPPWVFAVGKKPTKITNTVYNAPLANVFNNGRSCPGSHKYPERVVEIVQSFFMSFFTATAHLGNRSKKHPKNIIQMWEELDGKETYPVRDLVKHGTIQDLMNI